MSDRNMSLGRGCDLCKEIHLAIFSIRVDTSRVVTHVPQDPRGQREIPIIDPPSTYDGTPARLYLTSNGNALYDMLEQLLSEHVFSSVLSFADSRVITTIKRPIPIEVASTLLRIIRTYVYDHPFMLKAEHFNDWYSNYDGAWIVKIDDYNLNLSEMLKGKGLLPTRSHNRFESHGRWECVSVHEHGLFMCKGKYTAGSSEWRCLLRVAMGADEELMSVSEAVHRVTCDLQLVGPEQQALVVIAKASCVCVLRVSNDDDVGEERV